MTAPLLIVDGPEAESEAAADLELRGWRLHEGWQLPGSVLGIVCRGPVTSDDLSAVVLAALGGGGVLARTASTSVAERLGDDLRRIGPVQHRFAALGWVVLDPEERRLFDLLDEGLSLGDAAGVLHVGRRTADRRLASARARLGASSNAAAIAVRRRRLGAIPAAPG